VKGAAERVGEKSVVFSSLDFFVKLEVSGEFEVSTEFEISIANEMWRV
jgi:hypothetical protein